ncbi:hypothetical protein Pelo_18740 [Pelomyxa schiedti]|nr:hypothetical protein Pelo_18740 [Pelomyxa schiedti]
MTTPLSDRPINTPVGAGGWTELHYVRELLGAGEGTSRSPRPPVDPNTPDITGRTPLFCAAQHGHEAVVRLLAARPDVDVNKACPLAVACWLRWPGVAAALLECPRVDVNLAVQQPSVFVSLIGQTALHAACETGFAEGVRALLQVSGINANRVNREGETPLDVAKRRNLTDICNLLKAHNTRMLQSSKPTSPPPHPQLQTPPAAATTTTTTTTTAETATMTRTRTRTTSNVQFRAVGITIGSSSNDDGKQGISSETRKKSLNFQEITGTQVQKEITELNARITQLEEENAKLKLLNDETQLHQKIFADLTAKNKGF